ncbi:TPM domain-containing protein [Lapidilactobacillus wuchangensis]|uniref:TPM domain-containing protein n=1 Tax=Lapidilactobacillus wuchangensis TaxID=2486001 RepID=UPI001782861E|nr:TPM domain-containing protein [Lapidilactobacillus wuchangensis]
MLEKKKINWLLLLLVGLSCWLWLGPQSVQAATQTAWVNDQAQVLSQRTADEIDQINQETFAQVKGHPQLAVITVDHLPDNQDIDDYGVAMFEKYQVGRRDWDNGLLLTVAIADHQYRLTVGYGLEAVIPDGSKSQIVTTKIKNELKNERYDAAIRQMSEKISRRVVTQEAAIRTPNAIKEKRQRDQRIKIGVIIGAILLAGLVVVGIIAYYRQKRRWQAFALSTLRDEQFLQRHPLVRFMPWPDQINMVKTTSLPSKLTDVQLLRLVFIPYLREHVSDILASNPVALEYPAADYQLAIKAVSDRPLYSAKTLTKIVALLNPKIRQIKPMMLRYQQAFEVYSQQNNLSAQRRQQLWPIFTANVDYFETVTVDEALALFANMDRYVDRNGKLQRPKNKADLMLLPVWWTTYNDTTFNSGSGSNGSNSFGSGFGGGSTGGGGFSGGW